MTLRSTALLAFATFTAFAFAGDPTTKPVHAYPLTQCIISGDPLPTDGTAVVEQIDGREVRFCCADCVKPFKKDAVANQKKLDNAIADVLKATYPLKTCVVSGDDLGAMGKPVLYVYRATNQLVEFCCKDCVKEFEKNPSPFLAKIDATPTK